MLGKYQLLPGARVRLEAWFETEEPAAGSSATVRRPDGTVLAEGELDERGLFVFAYRQAENLKVVIQDDLGHRKELQIPASELAEGLARYGACLSAACLAPPSGPGALFTLAALLTESNAPPKSDDLPVERPPATRVLSVVVGVGILLAVAGLALIARRRREA